MKLLTTITALVLSFLASSQDLIEYRDFKFYQNGSLLSFDEVTELTKEYGVAKADFRQGRRDFQLVKVLHVQQEEISLMEG